jgi:nucleoside-diphosphate-sugar epimerase
MTATVLILGANGRLGQALVHAFVTQGWQVLAQVRPTAQPFSQRGVRWLRSDLRDTAALAAASGRVDVVVHALNPAYPRWATEALPLMDGAIALAQQLDALLMFPGNVYNFGADMPGLLDEHTPQVPSTRKGQIRVLAEQRLERSSVRSIILRAGDFFGSGKGSWFDLAVVKDIRAGKVNLPGLPEVATPWAYVPDLAQTFVLAAQRALAQPEGLSLHTTLCYSGYALSGSDWLRLLEPIAREQGWLAPAQSLRVGRLPWRLFKVLGLVVPMMRELAEMAYLPRTAHQLSGQALTRFLDRPVPVTPLPTALRAALADLGKI